MEKTITVVGATGNLGGRIVAALGKDGATVRALVRPGTAAEKTEGIRKAGAAIVEADLDDASGLSHALKGTTVVVSALQGLCDVIVDAQGTLLDAAISAGVPRFIPSDFASDLMRLPEGENRNFDLRREFHRKLDAAKIAPTSILNGAFGEILAYGTPLLDPKTSTVGYWEDADWRIDFTTMDDTAAYTARAALDDATPRVLRIASFQVSPRDIAALATEAFGKPFELVRLGSRDDLAAKNAQDRKDHPEGERELYPDWQQGQYMHSMFSVHHESLEDDRYPDLAWTSAKSLVQGLAGGGR